MYLWCYSQRLYLEYGGSPPQVLFLFLQNILDRPRTQLYGHSRQGGCGACQGIWMGSETLTTPKQFNSPITHKKKIPEGLASLWEAQFPCERPGLPVRGLENLKINQKMQVKF